MHSCYSLIGTKTCILFDLFVGGQVACLQFPATSTSPTNCSIANAGKHPVANVAIRKGTAPTGTPTGVLIRVSSLAMWAKHDQMAQSVKQESW
jgi:hypothetical protein